MWLGKVQEKVELTSMLVKLQPELRVRYVRRRLGNKDTGFVQREKPLISAPGTQFTNRIGRIFDIM